jgi:hypothetical protein
MRDNRSRMAALANRRIRVALYSSRSIPGTYVACHQHAGLFPVGPSVGKPVFDDPLPERLGNHRPRVADAELPGHHAPVFVGGGGGDAVHHAVGEGAVVRQPPGEHRISAPGKGEDRLSGDVAVVLQIIARQHGERRNPTLAPAVERFRQVAETSSRPVRVLQIVLYVGVPVLEFPSPPVHPVTAFGDRQRDDPALGVRHSGKHRFRVVGSVQIIEDGADHAGVAGDSVRFDDRVETILRFQCSPHGAVLGKQSHAANPPSRAAPPLQEIVEVDGLVGAMEPADADVHNMLRTVPAVVCRHRDHGWDESQVGAAQSDGCP